MAVVINNATKGIIFGYDGDNSKTTIINLETHFNHKPFNVKLLQNRGIDIVASGHAFVSDITFKNTSQDLDYFKIKSDYYLLTPEFYEIELNCKVYRKRLLAILNRDHPGRYYSFNKYRLATVDYYDPVNWALTYKMRGFTDMYCKCYPNNHQLIDSATAFAISFNLKVDRGELAEEYEYDLSIRSVEDSEDSDSNSESEDNSESDEQDSDNMLDTDSKHDKWRSIYSENDSSFDSDYGYYILSNLKNSPKELTPEHLKALKNITDNCLYVEYGPTPECIEVKERLLSVPHQSKVLDLYEKGSSEPYGTVIEISMTPPITDYSLQLDNQYYPAVANYYNKGQGIVLLGGEIGESMYYGRAMDDSIYIPDVFYDTINVPLDFSKRFLEQMEL